MKKKHLKKKIVLKKKKNKLKVYLACIIIFIIFLTAFIVTNYNEQNETGLSSSIKIISPENRTYNTTRITISISAGKSVKSISDSFDHGDNITECGGCNWYAIYDKVFTPGYHTVTAYVTDFDNKISKSEVGFTVLD
jgi:hypothetical protein